MLSLKSVAWISKRKYKQSQRLVLPFFWEMLNNFKDETKYHESKVESYMNHKHQSQFVQKKQKTLDLAMEVDVVLSRMSE